MSNEAQKDFWNGPAGDVWVEAQEIMDRMLSPMSDIAISVASPKAGERVIDVGCGCGGTTLALAASGASVWGVDLSEPMVTRAKERSLEADNIAYSVKDAATATYDADHHLIFSRFGVMFFDDPIAAFSNLRTSLVTGGRLVFVCWQSPRDNLFMSVAGRAAQPFMPPPEQPQDPRAPGPFAFADPDWIQEILSTAGFSDIQITPQTPNMSVGKTVDEAMYFQARVGPLARALSELDEATQEQAKQAVREALTEYETEEGVILPAAGWLVQAVNPD